MGMSFREGMQWITLISVAVVYGMYFSRVLPAAEADVSARQIVWFGWYTGLLIFIHAVGAALLLGSQRFREDEEDERDRAIAIRSRAVASYVLGTGIFACMYTAFFMPGNFAILHALLATLVVSQLVESAVQIVAYRRGY